MWGVATCLGSSHRLFWALPGLGMPTWVHRTRVGPWSSGCHLDGTSCSSASCHRTPGHFWKPKLGASGCWYIGTLRPGTTPGLLHSQHQGLQNASEAEFVP